MYRTCICHGKNHDESVLTPVMPSELDAANGDPPAQPSHTLAWFCGPGLRRREQMRRDLERGRLAYRRGKSA